MSVKIKIETKRCFPCHLFNNHTQCIQMISFFSDVIDLSDAHTINFVKIKLKFKSY